MSDPFNPTPEPTDADKILGDAMVEAMVKSVSTQADFYDRVTPAAARHAFDRLTHNRQWGDELVAGAVHRREQRDLLLERMSKKP